MYDRPFSISSHPPGPSVSSMTASSTTASSTTASSTTAWGVAVRAGCGPRPGLRITKARSAFCRSDTSFTSLPIATRNSDTPHTVQKRCSIASAAPFPLVSASVNHCPPQRNCSPRKAVATRISCVSSNDIRVGSSSSECWRACSAGVAHRDSPRCRALCLRPDVHRASSV